MTAFTIVSPRDLHNDVVDGNVDQLDKESNEAHDSKAYGRSNSDLLKL